MVWAPRDAVNSQGDGSRPAGGGFGRSDTSWGLAGVGRWSALPARSADADLRRPFLRLVPVMVVAVSRVGVRILRGPVVGTQVLVHGRTRRLLGSPDLRVQHLLELLGKAGSHAGARGGRSVVIATPRPCPFVGRQVVLGLDRPWHGKRVARGELRVNHGGRGM